MVLHQPSFRHIDKSEVKKGSQVSNPAILLVLFYGESDSRLLNQWRRQNLPRFPESPQ